MKPLRLSFAACIEKLLHGISRIGALAQNLLHRRVPRTLRRKRLASLLQLLRVFLLRAPQRDKPSLRISRRCPSSPARRSAVE